MNEQRMNEYVVNGGKLFVIKLIDTIRDGGTKIIKTTRGDYYVDKDSKRFHSAYAPSPENLITDPLLIEYLIERMDSYVKRCEDAIRENNRLLGQIQNTYNEL